MSASVHPPELIISLSEDKVIIHLLENTERGISSWQASFPVRGIFVEEEISGAMDAALEQNPALIDDFTCVRVVVIDKPNLCLPNHLLQEGSIGAIASKYLRQRAGDTLTLDTTSGNELICYCLPQSTFRIIREYYSSTDSIHLISLLWQELKIQEPGPHSTDTTLFFCLTANNLFVLSERNGKLTFSKRFLVRDHADVHYYLLACQRLLRPSKINQVHVQGESSPFDPPDSGQVAIDKLLHFPSIPALLSTHYPCAS